MAFSLHQREASTSVKTFFESYKKVKKYARFVETFDRKTMHWNIAGLGCGKLARSDNSLIDDSAFALQTTTKNANSVFHLNGAS